MKKKEAIFALMFFFIMVMVIGCTKTTEESENIVQLLASPETEPTILEIGDTKYVPISNLVTARSADTSTPKISSQVVSTIRRGGGGGGGSSSAVQSNEPITDSPVNNIINSTCSETDNGLDQYEKGITSGINATFTDYCNTHRNDSLQEFWCENGEVQDGAIRCDEGCFDGVCVLQPSCTDQDGGIISGIGGYAEIKGNPETRMYDLCENTETLLEAYCDYTNSTLGVISQANIECETQCIQNGTIAYCDGVFGANLSCTDDDGGIDFFVAGDVTVILARNNTETVTDSCISSLTVKEWYCGTDISARYVLSDCSSGYACEGGACVPIFSGINGTCVDSDDGKNIFVNGNVSISNSTTGGFVTEYDSCVNEIEMKEWFCGVQGDEVTAQYSIEMCPEQYVCDTTEKRCKPVTVNITTCIDSDALDQWSFGNPYEQGVVTTSERTYTDYCNTHRNDSLQEFWCENGEVQDGSIYCGTGCVDGRCNENPICTIPGRLPPPYCYLNNCFTTPDGVCTDPQHCSTVDPDC